MGIDFSTGLRSLYSGWRRENKKYLFLTNASERSPQELSDKLRRLGVNVE